MTIKNYDAFVGNNIEKCKNWKRHKGIRYPKCNNGNPCDACLQKYQEEHIPSIEEGVQLDQGPLILPDDKHKLIINTVNKIAYGER